VAASQGEVQNLTDLIAHADAALYRAKAAGRNSVVAY
jgi:PleD family two-component response regulator